MTNKQWCAYAYSKGWATNDSLKVWVSAGKITAQDYFDITGIEYVA